MKNYVQMLSIGMINYKTKTSAVTVEKIWTSASLMATGQRTKYRNKMLLGMVEILNKGCYDILKKICTYAYSGVVHF